MGSILSLMTPAANAGGNQDLTNTRKGGSNSGSGKPAKKHSSATLNNFASSEASGACLVRVVIASWAAASIGVFTVALG